MMKIMNRALLGLGLCLVLTAGDDAKPKLELSAAEQKILDATNKEREKEKLPALQPNPILFEVARAHSANMAKQREMKHELDGKNPADRIKAAGYEYSYIAENVAVSNYQSAAAIVKAWMESKEHKENIMNEKYTEIGIGVVKNEKGETYYTQEFGAPRKKP